MISYQAWLFQKIKYFGRTFSSSLNTENIFNIPVWYNSNLKKKLYQRLVYEGGENYWRLSKIWYIKGVKIFGDCLNENGNLLSRINFTERFHFLYTPPKLYNSAICALSINLTYLSIDKSSLKRDSLHLCYFIFFLKEKVTKYIHICFTSNDCVPTATNNCNAGLRDTLLNDLFVQDVFRYVLELPTIQLLIG